MVELLTAALLVSSRWPTYAVGAVNGRTLARNLLLALALVTTWLVADGVLLDALGADGGPAAVPLGTDRPASDGRPPASRRSRRW